MTIIAVIENNENDRKMIDICLKEKAYEVSYFSSLGAFLSQTESFDVIITDLSLADSFGMDTVHAVRAHVPDRPIIIVTGLLDETGVNYIKNVSNIDSILKENLTSEKINELLDNLF